MSGSDGNITVHAMMEPRRKATQMSGASSRRSLHLPFLPMGPQLRPSRACFTALLLAATLIGCSSANIVDVVSIVDPDAAVDSGPSDSAVGDSGPTDAALSLPTPNAAGAIVITEIMVDSAVAGNGDQEWFELYNPSSTAAWNLKGCAVSDPSGMAVIQVDLPIQPQERVVFGHQNSSTLLQLDFNYGSALAFNNSLDNDALFLRCGDLLIDEVLFSALPSPSPGYAMNLAPGKETAALNDVNASWCRATALFSNAGGLEDYGTPGSVNSVCPAP